MITPEMIEKFKRVRAKGVTKYMMQNMKMFAHQDLLELFRMFPQQSGKGWREEHKPLKIEQYTDGLVCPDCIIEHCDHCKCETCLSRDILNK